MASSLESAQVAGIVEVVADEIRSSHHGRLLPDEAVVAEVSFDVALFPLGGNDAGSARMAVGRQVGVHPQFVVDFA